VYKYNMSVSVAWSHGQPHCDTREAFVGTGFTLSWYAAPCIANSGKQKFGSLPVYTSRCLRYSDRPGTKLYIENLGLVRK
jgi:hypothetical protein